MKKYNFLSAKIEDAVFEDEVPRLPQSFARLMKQWRTNMGLTIGDLSKIIYVKYATLIKWEKGVTCPPNPLVVLLAFAAIEAGLEPSGCET